MPTIRIWECSVCLTKGTGRLQGMVCKNKKRWLFLSTQFFRLMDSFFGFDWCIGEGDNSYPVNQNFVVCTCYHENSTCFLLELWPFSNFVIINKLKRGIFMNRYEFKNGSKNMHQGYKEISENASKYISWMINELFCSHLNTYFEK